MVRILNNKRAQLDMEIFSSPGFWALLILTWVATAIGWIASKRMGMEAFPFWQVALFMVFEVVIVYVVAMKMFD